MQKLYFKALLKWAQLDFDFQQKAQGIQILLGGKTWFSLLSSQVAETCPPKTKKKKQNFLNQEWKKITFTVIAKGSNYVINKI